MLADQIDGQQQVVAPPKGDRKKVEAVVLRYVDELQEHAEQQYTSIWSRCESADALIKSNRMGLNDMRSAASFSQHVNVPESVNQALQVQSVFNESAFQNNELWQVGAINGESERRAKATKAVVDSELAKGKITQELQTAFLRYVTMPFAGLKACTETHMKTEYERIMVPGPEYEAALMAGWEPIGEVPTTIDFNRQYPMTRRGQKLEQRFPIRAINPRNFCKYDLQRRGEKAISCHEFWCMTKEEMERARFRNIESVAGDPTGDNSLNPRPSQVFMPDSGGPIKSWIVWETWTELPWETWLAEKKISPEDLDAFLEFHDIVPGEVFIKQKWQVFHVKQKAILKVCANPLANPEEYPYECESYFALDNEDVGLSFLEIVSDLNNLLAAFYNLLFDCVRRSLYKPSVLNRQSGVTREKMEALFKPNGVLEIDVNMPIEDAIKFVDSADITPSILNIISDVRALCRTFGVPEINLGLANAETATQDQISRQTGSQKTNMAFRRFIMHVLVPTIYKIIGLVYRNFSEERYIEVIGENGLVLAARQLVSPEDITNKISVQPVASFDLVSKNIRINQLISLENVFGRVLTPEQHNKILAKVLEYMNQPQAVIDEITLAGGSQTEVFEEIKVMRQDPNVEVKVRADDNHMLAIQAVMQEAQNNPSFLAQPNVREYVAQHLAFQQAIVAQQILNSQLQGGAQQQPLGGGRRPQSVIPPMTEEGITRQQAQFASPQDQGLYTNAGITGTGSPNNANPQ
ncbi:MAG: hypothetical protein N2111_13910 [Candidatus Sumerlaeaceae bacterium]|nr:hypothetical protein [Candidatus Sumerlaeaceae bacterium]